MIPQPPLQKKKQTKQTKNLSNVIVSLTLFFIGQTDDFTKGGLLFDIQQMKIARIQYLSRIKNW